MKYFIMLTDVIPCRGMDYLISKEPHSYMRILLRSQRDVAVLRSPETSSVIGPKIINSARRVATVRRLVEATLVHTVATACRSEVLAHLKPDDNLDFLTTLKEPTPWAANLHEFVFFEFFHAIVRARQSCRKRHCWAFAPGQYTILAQQIDEFLVLAGHSWVARVDVDLTFLEIAGVLDEVEEEAREVDKMEDEADIATNKLEHTLDYVIRLRRV